MLFDKIWKNESLKFKETRRQNLKDRSKAKKNSKKYRKWNMRGIIVMILIAVLWLTFYQNIHGASLYKKISGNSVKVVHSSISAKEASEIKILIDAGHGGFDNGASSEYVDEYEAQLNLDVALKLKNELEEMGFQVDMTRSDENALGDSKNADMAKRKSIIYNSKADILVSIHMNTHQNKKVNGPIVFYMPGSNKGNTLANNIQASMNYELLPDDPKSAQAQNFLVLRSGNMAGVLVECGFISNKSEAKKLGKESYQKKVAKSIALGIMDYFANLA